MKKNIYLLTFVTLCVYFIGCQRASEKDNKIHQKILSQKKKSTEPLKEIDTAVYISTIKKYVANTNNNLSSFRLKREDVFGSSTEGGEINIYSYRLDTLKLKAIYFGETGKNEYEFYFKDKQIVFFKEKTIFYKSPISTKAIKIDSISSTSFVLKKNKIVSGKQGKTMISKDEFDTKLGEVNDIYSEIKLQLQK